MKSRDKILVAFLISMGLFSASQAVQYVRSMPEKQKNALMPAVKDSARQRMLNNACSQVLVHGGTQTTTAT